MDDIVQLVRSGLVDWRLHGHVDVRRNGELLLFNYTHVAQVSARWCFFECVSRGLMLDAETGEIVARPFDKFFNWNEGGRTSDAPLTSVTEKMDGILGILYRNPDPRIATRGSLDSPPAVWATKFLQQHHSLTELPDVWTLLFEIVSPQHRLVVSYGKTAGLFLLAARNRFTGEYMDLAALADIANRYGFPTPKVYSFADVSQIIAQQAVIDGHQEGWVVEFADGQRFKFKGERYLQLHKLAAGITFNNTWAAVANGTVDVMRATVPDEFLDEFNGWVRTIQSYVTSLLQTVETNFQAAPKSSRREFAAWVHCHAGSIAPYLFARHDNRNVRELIFLRGFAERSTPEHYDSWDA
jgi:RNA ligase